MAKKSDILNQLYQSVTNPVPVEQQTPAVNAAEIADVKANEVQPTPVIPLTPAQQAQKDLEASGMGAYEYYAKKATPEPKAPDEKQLRRQRTAAGITDLALLLTDGIGAVAGGNVNQRKQTATENATKQEIALRNAYERQKAAYGENIYNARVKDSEIRQAEAVRKQNRDLQVADTKAKNDREDELFKKRQEWDSKVYGVKTDDQEKKEIARRVWQAEQNKLTQDRIDARNKQSDKNSNDKPDKPTAQELSSREEDAIYLAYRDITRKIKEKLAKGESIEGQSSPNSFSYTDIKAFVRINEGLLDGGRFVVPSSAGSSSSPSTKDYSSKKITVKKDYSKNKIQ